MGCVDLMRGDDQAGVGDLVADAEPGLSIAGHAAAETAATDATVAGVLVNQLNLGNLGPRVAFDGHGSRS